MKRLSNIYVIICFIAINACSSDTDFGEQYKKTIYIVNSSDMLYLGEHYYGRSNNSMSVSVYCASTEPVESPFKVLLKVDTSVLNKMNAQRSLADPLYKPKQVLPDAFYRLPDDMSVTIQAGAQYGTINIPLLPDGLNPDIEYALPISIESNDAGFDINPELQSIVYEVKMENAFSGTFYGISAESYTVIRSVMPDVKALSANAVRMPIHNLDPFETSTNYMKLVIADDSTSVSIYPWDFSNVEDLGGSTYNPRTQIFVLYYSFTGSDGTKYNITEMLRNLNAPLSQEEYEYGDSISSN